MNHECPPTKVGATQAKCNFVHSNKIVMGNYTEVNFVHYSSEFIRDCLHAGGLIVLIILTNDI